MLSLRRLALLGKNLQRPIVMPFADSWKERD